MLSKICSLDNTTNIRITSGRNVPIVGIIDYIVEIGTSMELLTFLTEDRRYISVVLG